jgi:hypothetical protein
MNVSIFIIEFFFSLLSNPLAMSAFIKFTNGTKAAANVGNVQFPDNAVMRDPLRWNAPIAFGGGLHFTTLEHANALFSGYTDVRDVRIPDGEFRVTLGKDRMKAHSLWMSAPRPVAELLKPLTHEQRCAVIQIYPSLLSIPGIGKQVLYDCPADQLITTLTENMGLQKYAATEEFVSRYSVDELPELIRVIPAAMKFIRDFTTLPVATLVAFVRSGAMVHTAPITEEFRRVDAPIIKSHVEPWTMWSNGMSMVQTSDGYVGTWMRDQQVLGGLVEGQACGMDCEHCALETERCWCGLCNPTLITHTYMHRHVGAFHQHDVVMFGKIEGGLPEGPFESRSADGRIRRGHLVAGVMHGQVTVMYTNDTHLEEYEFGVKVPVKQVKSIEPITSKEPRQMDESEAKDIVERTTAAVLERLTPPRVAIQNAFSALSDDA